MKAALFPPRRPKRRRRGSERVAAIVQTLEDRTLLAAPVAYDQSESTVHDQPIFSSVYADDLDFDPVTYFLDASPLNGDVDFTSDGNFTFTPDPLFTGSDSFTWHAVAGGESSNVATVSIDVTNNAPIDSDSSISTLHDQSAFADVSSHASDPDFDSLTFVVDTLPANGTLYDGFGSPLAAGATFDGNYEFAPAGGYVGGDAFTWHSTDGIADGNVATVTITVTNNAPIDSDSSISTLHDQSAFADVSSHASDPDFDSLTFVVDTLPANGTLYDGFGSPLSAGGTFDGNYEFAPAGGYVGGDAFTWHSTDGIANGNVATVYIDVTNQAPLAYNQSESTLHDQPLFSMVSADDLDFDPLMFSLAFGPANGALDFDSDGNFSFTPNPGFTGSDGFTWWASDGVDDSNLATVYIDVSGPLAPVITISASDPDAAEADLETGEFVVSRTGDTASDLTVYLSIGGGATPGVDYATIAENVVIPAGSSSVVVSVTPIDDIHIEGEETVTAAIVADAAYSIGTEDAALVWIADNEPDISANNPPIAVDDVFYLEQDSSLTVAASGVLENDFDIEGDSMSVVLVDGPLQAASFSLNSDGSVEYAPQTGFTGGDSFTYVVEAGEQTSEVATVTLTVTPVNATPTATSIPPVNAQEDDPDVYLALFDYFDDDNDADIHLTYAVESNTNPSLFSRIEIEPATGVMRLGFAPNDFGTADITLVVTDTQGASVQSTFTVTVAPVNDLPLAVDDYYLATPGETLFAGGVNPEDPEGVLFNDYDADVFNGDLQSQSQPIPWDFSKKTSLGV